MIIARNIKLIENSGNKRTISKINILKEYCINFFIKQYPPSKHSPFKPRKNYPCFNLKSS